MIDTRDGGGCVEYIPCIDLRLMTTKGGDILFADLIGELKRYGFNVDGRFVSYYADDVGMYINCGIDPIHPDLTISKDEIEKKVLRLRFQVTGQSLIHMVMSEEMNEAVNKMKEGGEQFDNKEP